MVADPSDEPDLGAQLARAIEDYGATWRTVDLELYDLCRRRPSHRSFADVYAKVAIIGRVYAAGISRSFRASGDAEAEVTRGLMSVADLIEQSLADLAGRQLDRVTAAQIVELHGRVARGLLPYTGETWQQSFVSKYLHFHCDFVPIYDGNAQEAIGRFVDWQLVAPVRALMADLPDWARAYRNFVAAFVVLRERISPEPRSQPASRRPITCSGTLRDPTTARRVCAGPLLHARGRPKVTDRAQAVGRELQSKAELDRFMRLASTHLCRSGRLWELS